MIVNDNDLLPIGPQDEPAKNKKNAQENDFGSRVAESYDSIESLLAAREEAEEAEAKAKKLGETPLPYAKEPVKTDKDNASASHAASKFTTAITALDDESPAPIVVADINGAPLGDARSMGGNTNTEFYQNNARDEELGEIPVRGIQNAGTLDQMPGEEKGKARLDDIHINELLSLTNQYGASDLHLTIGLPPMVRKDGKLIPLQYVVAREQDTQRIIYDILNNEQIEVFERTHELDFSYGVKGVGRFRFNVYKQKGAVSAAMRMIPNVIPSLEQLRLPAALRDLTHKHAGLVLVTGPTGSGKSTTIASLIDIINTERECHILTIEDPIEYLHTHKKGMVNQRELGLDTNSFNNALRASLREDPDVILVGEMRDLETIAAAITLAETGHLVFATLHTRSASATIDRIVDVFPSHQQEQIRIQLATSVEAIIAQQLLPRPGGGRVCAVEIMVATAAVRNLIREGKTHQINSIIETGQQYGMQAMDRVLADLYRGGYVTFDEAATRAIDRENFQRLVKGY